jgi:integrase
MPRPRQKAIFELGGQWIAKEPGSRNLYRFWTEPGTGRTRRSSLGTANLAQAKLKLAEIVIKGSPKTAEASLAVVLERYFDDHTDKLRSRKIARGHGRKLLQFFGPSVRVRALSETKQQEFVEECLDQGYKLSYAARIMVTLSAALVYSKIKDPQILYSEAAMVSKWKLSSSPVKKAYIPTDDECAQLIATEMPQMLFRWLIIQAMTCGRPETAVDLAPIQRNREAGVVDLNLPKRIQNKKYRPVVRTTKSLAAMLTKWEKEGLVAYGDRYCGYSTMEGVKSALQRLVAETGIPVSTYSVRHKVTTVLRRAKVPEDQISVLLGHRRPNLRTTAGYGEWDPGYLQEAAEALDRWFMKIRKLARAKSAGNSQDTPKKISVQTTRVA